MQVVLDLLEVGLAVLACVQTGHFQGSASEMAAGVWAGVGYFTANFCWKISIKWTGPAPPGIQAASLGPRQDAGLFVDDEELAHHAEFLVIENVTVVHVRSVVIGVGVEAGGNDDFPAGVYEY